MIDAKEAAHLTIGLPGTLRRTSRLALRPLSFVSQGEETLVGDPQSGVFLAIPDVGVMTVRALADGATIAQATEEASRHAGQEVDVLAFVEVLVESGFVVTIDGRELAPAADSGKASWLYGVSPKLARPFFGAAAWVLYGLLFTSCVGLLLLHPDSRPSFESLFFYPDPAVCMVTITVLGIFLAACHETFHYLAARAAGVGARVQIARRLFVPVFETNLTQLWSVPKHSRYSPFLAGMAFDSVVLAACLWLRFASASGLVNLSPLLVRALGAVVLMQVLGLVWQTLVFLRTDLYAVLITALGCFNLSRVTGLWLRRGLWHLRPGEAAELEEAHRRDRQVAPWFAALSMAGVAMMALLFARFFFPATVVMAGWMFASLGSTSPGSKPFWEAFAIGSVSALQALAPLAIAARQLAKKGRRGGS
jgi:hypothetical protein